jgi:hypothetical protein
MTKDHPINRLSELLPWKWKQEAVRLAGSTSSCALNGRSAKMPLPPPGTALIQTDKDRVRDANRNTCSASLMSDTKWRKLISVFSTTPSIDHYFLKSIRSPTEVADFGHLGGSAPHAFIDTLSFGPIYLSGVKWFELPECVAHWTNASRRPPLGYRHTKTRLGDDRRTADLKHSTRSTGRRSRPDRTRWLALTNV